MEAKFAGSRFAGSPSKLNLLAADWLADGGAL